MFSKPDGAMFSIFTGRYSQYSRYMYAEEHDQPPSSSADHLIVFLNLRHSVFFPVNAWRDPFRRRWSAHGSGWSMRSFVRFSAIPRGRRPLPLPPHTPSFCVSQVVRSMWRAAPSLTPVGARFRSCEVSQSMPNAKGSAATAPPTRSPHISVTTTSTSAYLPPSDRERWGRCESK